MRGTRYDSRMAIRSNKQSQASARRPARSRTSDPTSHRKDSSPSPVNGVDDAERLSDFDVKRQAILTGAASVFVRRGFSAGTTKEIAAEVGLSQPAIYHYVGSKADLLREIALQVDRDMLAALEAGLSRRGGPAHRLRGIIEEFTGAVVRDLAAFTVFWQELRSLPRDVREAILEDQRMFVRKVGNQIAPLQQVGRMPPGPVVAVAEAVLGMPSWMYHWYRPEGRLKAAELSSMFCALIGLDRDD